ncbi:hypothetical protein PENPOL_c004G09484 [Penicillium polonicum]|uniref:Uncharacterized protein n=1 Tax=Penicillium polonicum TaxID=60169 RepID=A0A1V6NP63_PENPO|nr:hypothetical protein PENPOL_c004G09484 [Penicillium polonicum]
MATNSQSSKMHFSKDPPSYEETTQVSKAARIQSLVRKLERARNGNRVLYILSNNELGVDDKCKAIEDADRIPALNEEEEAIFLESLLQLQGSHKLAQSVCYYYHLEYASKDKGWCKALIQADIEIRWIVQRIIWPEDSHVRECTSTGISLQNYAKIVRGEEVAVSGRADVAKDHERSMDLEQKGCTIEATALQHAPVVWMPRG